MDYQLSRSGQTAHIEVMQLPAGDLLPELIELEKELADQNLRRIDLCCMEGLSIRHNPESGLFFARSDIPLSNEQFQPMREPLASYISTRMRLA